MHTKFWSENLKDRDHSEGLGIHTERGNITMDLTDMRLEGVD